MTASAGQVYRPCTRIWVSPLAPFRIGLTISKNGILSLLVSVQRPESLRIMSTPYARLRIRRSTATSLLLKSFLCSLGMNCLCELQFETRTIWKRDKGSIPACAGNSRFTPSGNAGRGFYEVSKVLPFAQPVPKGGLLSTILLENRHLLRCQRRFL